ncbi:hypothetical protein FIBSPDRAFT_847266 [Athelia psychrophila]|uniref:Uncharacterized protein n=1 Tax=Athelia psychrophila TaxID=1759441 RepID=A0A166W4S1_9AGAM|nr:hypothetical protein FIBSPDRAFT_847266 [Fibularhizoctonia sp. CBS 109695]
MFRRYLPNKSDLDGQAAQRDHARIAICQPYGITTPPASYRHLYVHSNLR